MFKYILIFFLLIAFVPSFRRFIFWLLVGRKLTNQQQYSNQTQRQEGEIKVETNPEKNKNTPKNGQYVDYEEVK